MDRIGKLFVVESAEMQRCLCCDELFTRKQAPDHAQVPCRPAKNTLMQTPSELCSQ